MSNSGKNNQDSGNSVPSGHSSESVLVRLQRILPAKFIGRVVRRVALSQQVQLKNTLIKSFIRLYNVELSDALNSDPESYKSFNDFFTRELKPGARPIDESSNAVCSPADGTLAEFGSIRGSQMIQAKGIHYTIEQLFAGQALSAQQFTNGTFATVYLAPYNYHRIHMPLAGTLTESIYVPGKLLSVNAATTAEVQGLYAENERLIHIFKSDSGPFAVIMVGALNVGSMTTAWGGEIPRHVRKNGHHFLHTNGDPNTHYQKGDYLGHFNLGSTVIFIAGAEQVNWESNLEPGMTTWVGERMGHRQ
jgi:phosphatidylserine decarboxylase